tara:strand:+ start:1208 stop:2314 length:1107 start_codon:yes stop_codon:yes gene_type:complete
MGFSLSSFLGGAAGAGSRGLEERRANLQREKETAEARQWQIATEGRADARARKAARASKKRETEGLLEKLTFHYGADKAAAIVAQGKGYATEALGRGSEYTSAGYDPSTMVDIGDMTGEKLTAAPKEVGGIASPTALSQGALSFKPIPKKVTAAKNTWEAKIVEHTESKLFIDASDQDALTAWDRKNKLLTDGHAAWKNAADKDAGGSEGQLDFSKSTRDAILQKPIDDILRQNNLVELDVTGKIAKVLAGQEANVLALRARVIDTNAKAYKDVKDQPFQTKLAAQQAGIKTDTIAYVRKTVNKQGNPNIGSSNKKGFVPLAAGQTRTREQLENGLKTGEYIPNQVVQYTNEEGGVRFGVITPYGVLG